ncbi:hypothetical protein ACWCQS_44690 [Streptomyces sp. NPDC002076]
MRRRSPTEVADGASSVTTRPTTHRLATSIAAVKYGWPIGSRCCSSTTITSTGVWPTWTCSSRPVTAGGTPPVGCNRRAASSPSRAATEGAGSSRAIRLHHRSPRGNPQATKGALALLELVTGHRRKDHPPASG